jgi:protein phosphatase
MTADFVHASRSITGTREHQEDFCAVAVASASLPTTTDASLAAPAPAGDELICVLADGMGGHVAGARASATACRSFIDTYRGTDGLTRFRLANALGASNLAIAEAIREDASLEGMGCTLTAVSVSARGLRWVSVGDSPLYLFRDRHLYQLNADHSLAPVLDRLVQNGEMAPEEAERHPHRHFLRSALTGRAIELIDLADRVLPLEPDDWIVMASDGIETLSHAALANLLAEHQDADPETLVAAIITAVEAAGDPAQDNTTVLAIRQAPAAAMAEVE